MPDALQLQRNRSALFRAQREASRAASLARRNRDRNPGDVLKGVSQGDEQTYQRELVDPAEVHALDVVDHELP
jgi:hypothetical protein